MRPVRVNRRESRPALLPAGRLIWPGKSNSLEGSSLQEVEVAKTIKRREFIGRSAALGAAAILAPDVIAGPARSALGRQGPGAVGVAVASGSDYAALTAKAVERLGGMGRFVKKGAKVALLPNVQSRHPGTFTKPEILRATIKMCRAEGAAEIACLSSLTEQHWEGTGLRRVCQDEGVPILLVPADEARYKAVAIPGGVGIQEVRLIAEFSNYDAFLNLPITKDHAGNKFTGTMKNLMGLNSRAANRAFHKPGWKTDPGDIEFLE
ncbi:MAG: DUF362 domain-containing protein, partial [Candidatus Aminicenantes bacterium]|nr:DUF362 domain-containing protein [Candidatus Aminicenantes bacterium]